MNKDVNLTTEGSLTVGPVSINKDGINAGNKPITNVSNGTNGTDAVNLSQLNATKTKVEGDKGVTVTSTQNTDGGTTYKVTADTTTVTHTGGKVATPTGPTVRLPSVVKINVFIQRIREVRTILCQFQIITRDEFNLITRLN